MKEADEFPIALKLALQDTIDEYKHAKYLESDPILFPSRFKNPFDIEVIALFSCLYAYGNVKAIKSFLNPLLLAIGPSPYRSLTKDNLAVEQIASKIGYYRFQSAEDNALLLLSISNIVKLHFKTKSIEPIFESYFLNDSGTFEPESGISSFQRQIEASILNISNQNKLTRGLRFLIGDPGSKSAKKRICLFLRWMVRKDFPDFGIYSRIYTKDISFPLDVHIQRLIKILGISNRKSFGMRESILVRDFFRKLNEDDPLLYDFYLTRVGMIQKCRGVKIDSICEPCSLKKICLIGSATGN